MTFGGCRAVVAAGAALLSFALIRGTDNSEVFDLSVSDNSLSSVSENGVEFGEFSVDDFGSDDFGSDSVSGNDLGYEDYDSTSDFVVPYADYDTYYGSIGSTYLEYMRGFLPKLGFDDHYVAARVSQYTYIFAYGTDLHWAGYTFSGHDVMVVTFNTQNNGSYSYGVQTSFNLDPGSYLVYSDLTDFYPSLADSSAFTLRQVLILLTIVFLSMTMIHMYNVRKIRRVSGK